MILDRSPSNPPRFRPREYIPDEGPTDPISGGASAITGTATSVMMGVADMPSQTLKLLHIHPDARNKKDKEKSTGSEASSLKEESSSGRTTNTRSTTDTTEGSARSGASTPTAADGVADLARIQADYVAAANHTPSSTTSRSRSATGSTSNFDSATKPPGMADNIESAIDTGKGLGRIVGAGFKSPMNFSLNVAKGFHNLPKLYGSDVRQVDKVTDFQSGMRTAAKVIYTPPSHPNFTNIKV